MLVGAAFLTVGVLWIINLNSTGADAKPEISSSQSNTEGAKLDFTTVQAEVDSGAKLYDVRTKEEYASGHFKNAINWDVQDIQDGKLPDISKDTKIYVYCRSGNRSSQAAALLKDAGYVNVIDLGGLTDVQAIGGTLVN